MTSYEISKELLARLLREAKRVHTDYEKKLGRPDENWPEWYATYVLQKLQETDAARLLLGSLAPSILIQKYSLAREQRVIRPE